MRQSGDTYKKIGDFFDISRQLANQWVDKAKELEVAYLVVSEMPILDDLADNRGHQQEKE